MPSEMQRARPVIHPCQDKSHPPQAGPECETAAQAHPRFAEGEGAFGGNQMSPDLSALLGQECRWLGEAVIMCWASAAAARSSGQSGPPMGSRH
jgi:hypothetical protein